MKIIATCMASNEADVIEAFARHNASLLDALIVLDHASLDATPQILRALVAEGLPLILLHDPDPAFRQGERQTLLARRYLGELQADYCFALDADELLRCPSRESLEAALAAMPPNAHGLLAVQNFFGPYDAPGADVPRRLTRHLKPDRHFSRKVVLHRNFAADPDAHVALGNHAAVRARQGGAQPLRHAPLEGVVLAHYPVRSAEQVAKKALIGWLAHQLTAPERFVGDPAAPGAPASHWRRIFTLLTSMQGLPREQVVQAAIEAYAGGAVADHELVEDPLPVAYTLRHTRPGGDSALATLARWADRLVADLNASATSRGAGR